MAVADINIEVFGLTGLASPHLDLMTVSQVTSLQVRRGLVGPSLKSRYFGLQLQQLGSESERGEERRGLCQVVRLHRSKWILGRLTELTGSGINNFCHQDF